MRPSRATSQRQEIEELAQNPALLEDLAILPRNYSFEIPKTIWKIKSTDAKIVALQFPEGLTMYACVIVDILEKYTGAEFIILGDVTYGACCVDDFTARALGCELLVHYGHSCLVPIQDTVGIHLLYVFVNIDMGTAHFLDTIRHHFGADDDKQSRRRPQTLALVSTIQFVATLQVAKRELGGKDGFNIVIPQSSPLSPGELLGCTAPVLPKDVTAIVYLGDGRFHLESVMIQNPSVPAYQYNPYSRVFTRERYGFELMLANRRAAIEVAQRADNFGIILGTLGRQGNAKIFEYLEQKLKEAGKRMIRVLLSEIFADKLALFSSVQWLGRQILIISDRNIKHKFKLIYFLCRFIDHFFVSDHFSSPRISWAQVACPRLSIDWGHTFTAAPLLSPFELSVALDRAKTAVPPPPLIEYPMDFYAYDSGGPWTNNHQMHRPSTASQPRRRREHISLK